MVDKLVQTEKEIYLEVWDANDTNRGDSHIIDATRWVRCDRLKEQIEKLANDLDCLMQDEFKNELTPTGFLRLEEIHSKLRELDEVLSRG